MKQQTGVYAILNKATGRRYVGSSVDLARRKRTHFRKLRARTSTSVKLQRSWDKHGEACFEFEVLEVMDPSTTEAALRGAEQVWIDRFDCARAGYNVCRVAGEIGRLPKSPEHRAKIGAAQTGKKHSKETKNLISLLAKARDYAPQSAEVVARRAALLSGKKRSPEQRARISAGMTGKTRGPCSAERREAIAVAKRGKPLSESHKQRISEGLKAKKELTCL